MKTEFWINVDERTYYQTNAIPGRTQYGESVIPGANETVRVALVIHGITLVEYAYELGKKCFIIYFDTLENMNRFQVNYL